MCISSLNIIWSTLTLCHVVVFEVDQDLNSCCKFRLVQFKTNKLIWIWFYSSISYLGWLVSLEFSMLFWFLDSVQISVKAAYPYPCELIDFMTVYFLRFMLLELIEFIWGKLNIFFLFSAGACWLERFLIATSLITLWIASLYKILNASSFLWRFCTLPLYVYKFT